MWFKVNCSSRINGVSVFYVECSTGDNVVDMIYGRLQLQEFERKLNMFHGNSTIQSVYLIAHMTSMNTVLPMKDGYDTTLEFMNDSVPLYTIRDEWWINSISPALDCEGCRLVTNHHVNCPDGCLHNPRLCEDCSVVD